MDFLSLTREGFIVHLSAMALLSRFQTELLDFFQGFLEEESRPPRLEEIAVYFGLGEEAVQNQIAALRRRGFLLFCEFKNSSFRILSRSAEAIGVRIPLLGSIPAGIPETCVEELDDFIFLDLSALGVQSHENLFALHVRGDSMTGKGIFHGDIAVLHARRKPKNGEVVAALVDDETTLKTFLVEKGRPFLRAENPAYRDIHPAEELKIQGVMVGLLPK
jgi:repressor LexA